MATLVFKQLGERCYTIDVEASTFVRQAYHIGEMPPDISYLSIPDTIPAYCYLHFVFPNKITIMGNIPLGAKIEANGELIVEGNVGVKASLKSTGDLTVRGQVDLACLLQGQIISVYGNVIAAQLLARASIRIHGVLKGQVSGASSGNSMKQYTAQLSGMSHQIAAVEGEYVWKQLPLKRSLVEVAALTLPAKNNNLLDDEEDEKFAQELEAALESEMPLPRPTLAPFQCPADYPESLQLALRSLHHQLAHHDDRCLTLYPHQEDALIQHVNFLMAGGQHEKDQRNVVYHSATGTGKSILFTFLTSVLASAHNRKMLIVVPRVNLQDQIIATLKKHAAHLTVTDDTKLSAYNDVTVTTYQALKAKIRDIKKNHTKVLNASNEFVNFFELFDDGVLDEAHNACAEGGIELVKEMINAVKKRKGTISAFTATPTYNLKSATKNKENRVAEKSIYAVLGMSEEENPITPFTMQQAVAAGVLAPVKGAVLSPELNAETKKLLSSYTSGNNNGTDIQENKIGRVIDKEPFNRLIVDVYANSIDPDNGHRLLGQQGVVFCAGVNHAENVASLLNACIPLDHPLVAKARAAYTAKNPLAEFAVAKAIHAGAYQVRIDFDKIPDILNKGQLTYERNGQTIVYPLKPKDIEKLNKKNLSKTGCTIQVATPLSEAEKDTIIADYKEGRYLLLCGADMLTEGFDHCHTNVIINARPTKSKVMKVQSCGRGVRKRQDINPNKIAYIIDFNWGIKGQLFFTVCLGGEMRLGQFPELPVAINNPFIDIPHKSNAYPLTWEKQEYLYFDVGVTNAKRERANELPNGKRQRNEAPISLDESVQLLKTRLQSLEPTITQLSTLLNREQVIVVERVVHSPTDISPNTQQHVVLAAHLEPANPVITEAPKTAQTATPFTRQTKANIKALQVYTDNITQQLKDILAAIHEAVDEQSAKVATPKKRHASGAASSSDTPPHVWHTHTELDNPIQELMRAQRKLAILQSQLQQLTEGYTPIAAGSSSAANSAVLQSMDIQDIMEQCMAVAEELETIPQRIPAETIIERVNKAREKKNDIQGSALSAAPGATLFSQQRLDYEKYASIINRVIRAINKDDLLQFERAIKLLPTINYPLDIDNACGTALHVAANKGRISIVNWLLAQPTIQVNAVTAGDITALDYAAWDGFADIVSCLINKNANVNRQMQKTGDTLLHTITDHLFCDATIETVRRLLSVGADVAIRNNAGDMPKDKLRKHMWNVLKGEVAGMTCEDKYYLRKVVVMNLLLEAEKKTNLAAASSAVAVPEAESVPARAAAASSASVAEVGLFAPTQSTPSSHLDYDSECRMQ